jgi:hypothetical protein
MGSDWATSFSFLSHAVNTPSPMNQPAHAVAITPRRRHRRGVFVCGIANRSRCVRSVTDANGLRTLIEYDAFGLATRKQFRGSTDAVRVAPDQQMAVTRCVAGGPCWRPVEQYQVMTVQC